MNNNESQNNSITTTETGIQNIETQNTNVQATEQTSVTNETSINSIKCPNCGGENIPGSHYCVKCGNPLVPGAVNDEEENSEEKIGNILGIISLVLYFGGPILGTIISSLLSESLRVYFSSVEGMSNLAALIIMIVGRVKYPSNKLLKTVMWIMIYMYAIGIILFILFIIWCTVTCSSYDTSGCG